MNALTRWYLLVLLVVMGFMPQLLVGQNSIGTDLKGIEEKMYYYPRQAERMLDSLLQQHPIEIENDHLGELNFLQGFLSYHKGEMDTALNHMETALMTFTRNDQPEWQGKCYLLMGWIAEGDNYLEQAKIYYYEAIRLLGNQPGAYTGLAYLGVARCKEILNEKFSEELDRGVEYLNSTGKVEYQLYAETSHLMFRFDDLGSITRILGIADRYIELGLNDGATNIFKALASFYSRKNEPNSAMLYVNKAIQLFDDSYPGVSLLPALHQLKGNIYYSQNNFEDARKFFQNSLQLYESHGQITRSYYAWYSLYLLDRKQQNYKAALDNLVRANKYRNQSNLKEKQRMAKALEIAAGVGLLNEQIEKNERQRQQQLFIIVFLVAIIAIILLIVLFTSREKKQKKKRLNAIFQSLVAFYKERLNAIEVLKDNNEGLSRYLKKNLSGKTIEEGYSELFRLFCGTFTSLSKTELNYALMFAMDFPEDDICRLQNIQLSSIRKIKQRIREKLNLDKNEELNTFFQTYLKL